MLRNFLLVKEMKPDKELATSFLDRYESATCRNCLKCTVHNTLSRHGLASQVRYLLR